MSYLHGYSEQETDRLRAQARFLARYVLADRPLDGATRILEVGSGVGAQTELLLERYPNARITAVEREPSSHAAHLDALRTRPELAARVTALCADATSLPADLPAHDAAYLCWVLEHVPDPVELLRSVRERLAPGAKLQVQEVFNQSFAVRPAISPNLAKYLAAFDAVQIRYGGDPHVGCHLGQLLHEAGYVSITTSAILLQADDRAPAEREAMFDYLATLYRSAEPALVTEGSVTTKEGEAAGEELRRLGRTAGVSFHYTAMRAVALAPGGSS